MYQYLPLYHLFTLYVILTENVKRLKKYFILKCFLVLADCLLRVSYRMVGYTLLQKYFVSSFNVAQGEGPFIGYSMSSIVYIHCLVQYKMEVVKFSEEEAQLLKNHYSILVEEEFQNFRKFHLQLSLRFVYQYCYFLVVVEKDIVYVFQ